jgi:hypothetical protein
MEIGKPLKTFTIEPLESPVPDAPQREPEEAPVEQRPDPLEQPAAPA